MQQTHYLVALHNGESAGCDACAPLSGMNADQAEENKVVIDFDSMIPARLAATPCA